MAVNVLISILPLSSSKMGIFSPKFCIFEESFSTGLHLGGVAIAPQRSCHDANECVHGRDDTMQHPSILMMTMMMMTIMW